MLEGMKGSEIIDYLIPIVSQFFLGPILIVFSIIFLKFPPKEINPLYGYRTKRSMQSQEHWDYANKEFSQKLFVASVLTTIVQILCSMFYGHIIGITMGLIAIVVFIPTIIIKIETDLKKKQNIL